ncbi:hypothetical protein [Rhizobacter sp. Root1221]|uniref:hypothetical protein n=1 Tax=Rhizobacter sp. Root1221 TaxID=1736433 RepID=UPI0019107DB5|nr:hypothetical protein [Rhizobacter sp. Root1221]
MHVKKRLGSASQKLRTANPSSFMEGMIEDSFVYPAGDPRYARNALAPGSAPIETLFSTAQPRSLSFNLEPLGPDASGGDRRDMASREMRRMIGGNFGNEALRWFDGASESQRGLARSAALNYGAFFGSSFDANGLQSATITYEGGGHASGEVNPALARLIGASMSAMPGMRPIFTTLIAGRDHGSQWITFLMSNGFRLVEMQPMLDELGLGGRLAGLLQIVGIALGGRFDIPPGAALVAFGRGPQGVELELQVMLDAIADVPPNFLQLLTMNLRERPRELGALESFLDAFTPDDNVWPGRFSILGIRIGPTGPPKVSLFLRPIEFEITPAAARMPNGGAADVLPSTAG